MFFVLLNNLKLCKLRHVFSQPFGKRLAKSNKVHILTENIKNQHFLSYSGTTVITIDPSLMEYITPLAHCSI